MLKSMLVALDGIADHRAILDSAVFLARRFGAAIEILLTVDRGRVFEPEAFGIGSVSRHEHLEETLLQRLRAGVEAVRAEAEQAVAAAGGEGGVALLEGAVEHELALEAQCHDLVLLSSGLRRRRDEDIVEVDYALQVERLVREVPRPLLLADRQPLGEGPIIAAYDARPGAARALHALLYLGLAEGRPLHVVSVGNDQETAAQTARLGVSLAERYGIATQLHGTQGEVASTLLAEIEALRPALVVMGSHHPGPPTWREWLFGTTAAGLLDRVECPVLVSS